MTNEQLVIRIQAGEDIDGGYMLQLWQQNQGMIGKLARRYSSMADEEDLMQEGYLALYEAVDHYRPHEGASFLTYALFWIKQRMIRYGSSNGTIRVPAQAGEQARRYRKLISDFTMQVGRRPTEREICYYMGVTGEMLGSIQKVAQMAQIDSLDTPVEGTEGLTIGDIVASPGSEESTIMNEMQAEQLKAVLWPLVDSLPDDQPKVIRARYQEGKPLRVIGEEMGCTINQARQIEYKGLRELRKPSRCRKLRPYQDEYISTHAYRGCGAETFIHTWESSTERTALQLIDGK